MNKLENNILTNKLKKLECELEENGILKERCLEGSQVIPFCFVLYILIKHLDNNVISEIIDDVTDGKNDQSIDIFNIDDDDNNITINLFQVKYKENKLDRTFGENEISQFLNKIERIFINGDIENLSFNEYFEKKYKEYQDLATENIKFQLFLITNGGGIKQQEQNEIEKFENKHSRFSIKFENNLNYFINERNNNKPIKIKAQDSIVTSDALISYTMNVKTYEICKLYEQFGDTLLDHNVRKLLNSKLNKEIENSIKKSPKMFWYKNNGISIICKRVQVDVINSETIVELEEPYIVNGGQTAKILYNIYKKFETDKEKEIFAKSSILVRVHQTTDKDKINQIVIGTNTQNKINLYDLKSNIPNLNNIKLFFEQNGISLVTKRDSEEKKLKYSISSDRLLQIYCSIYKKVPHKAKISKTKLIEEYYEEVYSNPNSFKELLLSYRLYFNIEGKHKKSITDHSRHSLFSVLFYMSLIDPDILNINKEFNLNEVNKIYIKSMTDIDNIINIYSSKPNSNYTHHNFFKSEKSTKAIMEYCST